MPPSVDGTSDVKAAVFKINIQVSPKSKFHNHHHRGLINVNQNGFHTKKEIIELFVFAGKNKLFANMKLAI